jgi:excisionase family DNA binding protein
MGDEPVRRINATVEKEFCSISEFAEEIDVNPRTVRRWIDKGDLVAHRFGRQFRLSRADRAAFVRARREG